MSQKRGRAESTPGSVEATGGAFWPFKRARAPDQVSKNTKAERSLWVCGDPPQRPVTAGLQYLYYTVTARLAIHGSWFVRRSEQQVRSQQAVISGSQFYLRKP